MQAQINYDCKVMNANFSGANGYLTERRIGGIFGLNKSGSTHGLGNRGRTTMKDGYLQTKMPRGEHSGKDTGFRFDLAFPGTNEAELRYRVWFDGSYHWTLGGKLPGLGGGGSTGRSTPPRGCTSVKDKGFSARLMFRNNSGNEGPNRTTAYMINYLYYQNTTTNCGTNQKWDANLRTSRADNVEINRGTWYEFRQYIKNSTAGRSDGRIKTWYRQCTNNNRCSGSWIRVVDKPMAWRKRGQTWNINKILMETYHGGKGSDWEPNRTNYVRFDDFVLYRKGSCPKTNTIGDGLVTVHTVDRFEHELEAPRLEVYPNPTDGDLNLQVFAPNGGEVQVLDLTGRVLRRLDVAKGDVTLGAQVGDLAAGVYVARFIGQDHTVTRQFVKR